jgi:hypothetical protein
LNDPSSTSTPSLPRARYGALMGLTCVAATVGAGLAARLMGGGEHVQMLAVLCVGCASTATFLPVLLAGKGRWGESNFGIVVLGASMARTLLLLALALVVSQGRELSPRPFWIGILAGGGVVLMVESLLAVTLLARLEREKSAGPLARP